MSLNILITSDDGPEATGLSVLREAVKKVWTNCKPVVIVPSRQQSGSGFNLSPGWDAYKTAPATQIESDVWTVDLTPVDVIYRAHYLREEFSNRDWDLVLVGCNAGVNLGTDVFHSGTCAAAMVAAKLLGTCAYAFSQDIPNVNENFTKPNLDRTYFTTAERIIPDFLRKQAPDAGNCLSINFPEETKKGYKDCKTAHYSYHRPPPTSLVPRSAKEVSDIQYLSEGWVTVSQLDLRVNPNLRF